MPTLIDNLNQIESIKTDIRSAIQDKGVDMTGVSFVDYPSKIGDIQTGGTGYTVDDIIDGYLPGVTSINSTCNMFNTAGCWYTVETVNLPNAEYIAGWAFWQCPNLTYVSAPAAVEIDLGCFQQCQNLSEAYVQL